MEGVGGVVICAESMGGVKCGSRGCGQELFLHYEQAIEKCAEYKAGISNISNR